MYNVSGPGLDCATIFRVRSSQSAMFWVWFGWGLIFRVSSGYDASDLVWVVGYDIFRVASSDSS